MLLRELDSHLPTWPWTTKDDDRIGVRTVERVLRWPDKKRCAERQEQRGHDCDNCEKYPGALLSAHGTTIARLTVDTIEATVEHKSGMWPKVAVVAELGHRVL